MSALFIDLYLDEDFDVLVADLVRARGFKVITTQEAGNVGATDRHQLAAALSLQTTFVTHTIEPISSCSLRNTLSQVTNITESLSQFVALLTARSPSACDTQQGNGG